MRGGKNHHDANFVERFEFVDDSDDYDDTPARSDAPPPAVQGQGQALLRARAPHENIMTDQISRTGSSLPGEPTPAPRDGRVASSYPPVFTGNRGESYKEWKRGVEFWIPGEAGARCLPTSLGRA